MSHLGGTKPATWDRLCTTIVSSVPKPPATQYKVYIDDGLNMGPSQSLTTDYTYRVIKRLEENKFVISPKSRPEAATQQDYIGKTYANGNISNTGKRLSSLLAL